MAGAGATYDDDLLLVMVKKKREFQKNDLIIHAHGWDWARPVGLLCDNEEEAIVSEACMSVFTVQCHIFISLPGTKFPSVHLS